MRSRVCCLALALACFTGATSSSPRAAGQSRSAADWLPSTTVFYVEAAEAQTFVDLPLGQKLVANALVQELWRSPGAMKVRGGITLAELALGERVPAALIKATAQGAVLAVDIETEGVALLAHTKDAATCEQLLKKLVQLAQNAGKNKQEDSTLKQHNYRGLVAYEVNQVVLTNLDDWLLVTNKGELGKKIVDNYRDSSTQSLSTLAAFTAAREQLTKDDEHTRLFWAWTDVAGLRARGAAKNLFKKPDENFVAELLLGGLLATIRDASTASATLTCDADQLRLTVNMREATAVKLPEYEFFFGADGKGVSPAPIRLDGQLLTLAAYRDVAELWRRAGDLFGQRTNDQLAVADATLTTLFSGKDFGEEILGAIEPGVQIVAASQDFSAKDLPQPRIQLPAFALITKLRQPSEMQPQLRRIFMSLVGFINITGAMNQQPQLDLETLREDGATYVLATYAVEVDRPRDWAVPIQFNFSPTLALVGEHAVLASTGTIARAVVQKLEANSDINGRDTALPSDAATDDIRRDDVATDSPTKPSQPNTVLLLHGEPIAKALASNRDQLISQNMLEKGHTQEEAAGEIDTLLRLAGLVDSFEVSLSVHSDVEINAALRLKP